jgi:predicted dehydrogenase
MLRIGVIGGENTNDDSVSLIHQAPNCTLQGLYNSNSLQNSAKHFENLSDLMDVCDAFYILNPLENAMHAESVVRQQKHCIIESPFAPSSEAGNYFINLVREADVKIHISNPDRYNNALLNTHSYFQQPVFIETNRLKPFSEAKKNTSLVMDLMIHDIDIILHVVKAAVKKISATGVAVVSKHADIVNARIEFENGCIANLTASRINPSNEHKISFYEQNIFVKVDYLNKTSEVFNINNPKSVVKNQEEPDILDNIFTFSPSQSQKQLNEMEFFVDSVLNNTSVISMANCLSALEIAYAINDKVKNNLGI